MEHSELSALGFRKKNSGIALILVLMLVVLITIMILAFFLSTQTETKSMRSVVSGQNSRQLADIAVQSVISQIQLATTQGGTTNAWVSQPGMIRTYKNSGAAAAWYKLYSSTTNIVSNPTESLANVQADLPSQPWAAPGSANYGVYTDINSPVYAANGTSLEYPIVNPGSATSLATASTNVVLGFDIATGSVTGYNASSSYSPTNNPAAMPVLWIYILADGTQVPGAASGTPGTVTVAGASTSNPIVGRIAYWTDDETCKLNVNTAGDGTYFDTPRFDGSQALTSAAMEAESTTGADASGSTMTTQDSKAIQDWQLSVSPPFASEYQRFIGGPAQTRLSYALPALTTLSLANRSQLVTQLTPFLQWGGSEGGIQTAWDYQVNSSSFNLATLAVPARQTPYASLDEWMFTTQLSGTTRIQTPQNVAGTPGLLTNTRLQQLRFFLSANSDAPEVTLAGQPRVAIWPLTSSIATGPDLLPGVSTTSYTTALDRMLAKAATLTPTPTPSSWASPLANSPIANYYFTRFRSAASSGALSPYMDWNGSSSSSSFSLTAPTTRNQSLFIFLHNEAKTAIPGYGGIFTTKYSIGSKGNSGPMDQLITEIFDYIRCTNLDDTTPGVIPYSIARPDGTTASPSPGGSDGGGQVAPIIINNQNQYFTQGLGRFYTVNGLALDFVLTGTTTTTETITPVVFPSLFSPSLGPTSIQPDMRIEILPAGLNGLTLNGQPLFSATPPKGTTYSVMTIAGDPITTDVNRWNCYTNGTDSVFLWGGDVGPRLLTAFHGSYPFIGNPISLPKSTGTLTFGGGPIKINVSCNYEQVDSTSSTAGQGFPGTTSSDLVQSISLILPSFTVSGLPTGSLTNVANALASTRINWNYPVNYTGTTTDVVRSIVAGYNGDSRLVAAQHTITTGTILDPTASSASSLVAAPFVLHPLWTSTNTQAHALRDIFPVGTNPTLTLPGFNSAGLLLPSTTTTYKYPTANGYVSNATGSGTYAPQVTRDFDNGPGILPDGPYINKPDEAGSQYVGFDVTKSNNMNTDNAYFTGSEESALSAYCSPNRMIASPVMFGSLPTGVPMVSVGGSTLANPVPWQTLLFRPQAGHPGENPPEDELLLDWFWMPVVEPYAISNTFDTEGKVNMNYQIAPFTYITRSTALMGVLGSEYVIAVPNTAGKTYKSANGVAPVSPYRMPVKVLENDNVTPAYTDGTLRPFQDRFAAGQIFKSAAEICDIYLVPVGQSWTNWALAGAPTTGSDAETFWSNNQLTGDNSRERPYNGLYSRLTTKSNTYTVHVRAQALAMPKTTPAGEWIENPQLITSEYRGSVTLNRYLDPQDPNIPDFALPSNSMKYSLDSYYKYRVLEARRFLP